MYRLFLFLGAANAGLAVAFGAFGAHGLKGLDPAWLAVYRTAAEYHMYHALGLLAIGALGSSLPASRTLDTAGWLMLVGIVLFSGSLYALSLSGLRWLGAIAPFGGTAFIAAWALLSWAALRAKRTDAPQA